MWWAIIVLSILFLADTGNVSRRLRDLEGEIEELKDEIEELKDQRPEVWDDEIENY